MPARIWNPPGHWRLLAFLLLVVLVAIAFQGFATHTIGPSSEPAGSATAPLANARPILAARGSKLVSVQPPAGRRIALTFDDGPYPVVTPLLLQTLRDLRVPATFFLIGRDAEQYPDLTRAIAAGGHEIADHTLTHPDLDRLSDAAVAGELRDGAASLERIAPDPAERRLFRPPHGRFTVATLRAAQSAGFDTILWSDDPGDWRDVTADALRDHVLAHAVAPEIVLLHSGRQATVAALPEVVDRFRRAGYTFVTVGALLRRSSAEQLNRPAKVALGG
ncbi:MAG: polysaccharide deacetylase family protein [Candidatus Eremiobacteraeota bacterium]|nr:polysaccharide deacetylase family protein [Candidatus Eremiobacteraeota bacterium]